MPFDPRIISSDDSSFEGVAELELPDDLLQLADQLRDDAAFLSNRYTPESLAEHDSTAAAVHHDAIQSSEPKRRRMGFLVLLSSLATVFLLLAMLPKATDTSKDPVPDRFVTDNNPAPNKAEEEIVRENLARNTTPRSTTQEIVPSATPLDTAPFGTVPVLLLHSASGPEQEAILDLIQQGDSQETVLSI